MRDKAVYGLRVAHIALTAIAWIYIGATDTEEGAKAVSYGIIVGAVLAACTYFLTWRSFERTIALLSTFAALVLLQAAIQGSQGRSPIEYVANEYILMSLVSLGLVGIYAAARWILRPSAP
jgi:hypothetical protein